MRWSLFGLAVLWLLIEAVFVLEATFHVPCGFSCWALQLASRAGLPGWIGRLLFNQWPTIFAVFLLLVRQEAKRWLKNRQRFCCRERVVQLIIGWFVFLGTLKAVDFLSPDVTVVLPHSAIDTSITLAILGMAGLFSSFAHWIKRMVTYALRVQRRFRLTYHEALRLIVNRILRRRSVKKGPRRNGSGLHSNHGRAA